MSDLKAKIPDLAALDDRLDKVLESSLTDFLAATNIRRQELIGARRFAAISASFAIAVAMALFFLADSYGTWFGNIMIGVTMIWVVLVIIAGRRWLMNERLLVKEMSMALVPILAEIFDEQFMYTYNEAHMTETEALLLESQLITYPDITIVSDDLYQMYDEGAVSFRELQVTRRVKSGKSESIVEVFKGIFMIATLPQDHPAETYVSTEGDRSGFAHRTFWHDLFEFGKIEETVLEWNDFEKDLHVASSDPMAARQILTPDFMEELHTWWLEHKLNIRIAFKGARMYLLLPESTIKISAGTTSTNPKRIRSFALSLAKPMWRALRLFEDVKS